MRWPISKPTRLVTSATGKASAAMVAALAASTARRAGRAVKVARIMPVEYSAVMVRTARAPRTTAANSRPIMRGAGRVEGQVLLGGHGVPLGYLGGDDGGPEADGDDHGAGHGAPGGAQGAQFGPFGLEGSAER